MARPLRAELHSQRANCPLRRPAQLTDSQARTVKQLLHRILQSSYIGSFPPNRAFNGRRGFAARVNWFVAHAALRTRVAERSSCAKFARTSASATGGQTELPIMRTWAVLVSGVPSGFRSITYSGGQPCAVADSPGALEENTSD